MEGVVKGLRSAVDLQRLMMTMMMIYSYITFVHPSIQPSIHTLQTHPLSKT